MNLEPGASLEPQEYAVTRADLVRYAGASGDRNPIHWSDRVATAVGWRPRGPSLAERIDAPEVLVLGDADRPGDFVSAINAGADAGLAV